MNLPPISPNKSFLLFDLRDDDEALFACVASLNFISSYIFFMSISSFKTSFKFSVSSLDSSKMKLNPLDDDNEDEEDESFIVTNLCTIKL